MTSQVQPANQETEVEPSKFGGSGSSGLDPNVYATKKTIAQGMLDVALLTANASQLKYLLQLGKDHDFYYLMVTLISLSLILQVLVGCIFIFIGMRNMNKKKNHTKINTANNAATVIVFLITTINIIASGFGLSSERKV
ncbi:ninjurin-2-like isoform X4 [Brevipalpus obovatus]|uniref:ninjurin-2-like isoform X4 n=1 Tax=Brevipalpus obovatus TaxID=246614 RepID=UPI003D9EC919